MQRRGKIFCWGWLTVIVVLAGSAPAAPAEVYDPLRVQEGQKTARLDLTVIDAGRQRQIPLRVYLPADPAAAPVILFSHGLGGSREGSAYLPAVLDQLEQWHRTQRHVLAGRPDLSRIGMAGHSFGAVTTQAVSGQRFAWGLKSFTDPRIKAAVLFSPSRRRHGVNPEQAFGAVTIPWLLMTGTKDVAFIGNADVASRLAVFPALPPGGKYEVVLDQAEHSAFSDRALPGLKES
jgi:predicted dienelactone hydrolase